MPDATDRCRQRWPDATHIACFDTAFHTSMPIEARTYALPARLREKVRVYGFHGLSHAWAAGRVRAARPDDRRVVIAARDRVAQLADLLDDLVSRTQEQATEHQQRKYRALGSAN